MFPSCLAFQSQALWTEVKVKIVREMTTLVWLSAVHRVSTRGSNRTESIFSGVSEMSFN